MSNPVSELRQFLTGWSMIAKAKRLYSELLGVEAAQDIAADVVAHQRKIEDAAHKAETYSREALRLMDEAQAPDSDGGENITPAEAKRIRAFELKSAECDHNAGELAHV